ncbi:D-glycerate 3-kinase [Pseudoalteromonas luteoviolacea B = ATCC 29581]|nr:D-glycerate 3-kinase [Pseudoalteromonas luteoviolacea B = ATCC 29581]
MDWQQNFVYEQHLSVNYLEVALRIATRCWQSIDQEKSKPIVFIAGAQGSGKSTLAQFLCLYLTHEYQQRVGVVSLDDYYLSSAQRVALASQYHPLFKTRGVPGTHDVMKGLDDFRQFKRGKPIVLPRFDKSTDNPTSSVPSEHYDVLIFEGWCVGVSPEPEMALTDAINRLEATQDGNGVYRQRVNQFLSDDYQAWFQFADYSIFLEVPSFEHVLKWRIQQEHQLRLKMGRGMSDDDMAMFIAHFERLTKWALQSMPTRADLHVKINDEHTMSIIDLQRD